MLVALVRRRLRRRRRLRPRFHPRQEQEGAEQPAGLGTNSAARRQVMPVEDADIKILATSNASRSPPEPPAAAEPRPPTKARPSSPRREGPAEPVTSARTKFLNARRVRGKKINLLNQRGALAPRLASTSQGIERPRSRERSGRTGFDFLKRPGF